MSADQRGRSEKELRDGYRDLERKRQEIQDDFNARRNEEMSRLQRTLIEEVRSYSKAQGYDLVLADGVLFANPSLDITPAVLANWAAAGRAAPAVEACRQVIREARCPSRWASSRSSSAAAARRSDCRSAGRTLAGADPGRWRSSPIEIRAQLATTRAGAVIVDARRRASHGGRCWSPKIPMRLTRGSPRCCTAAGREPGVHPAAYGNSHGSTAARRCACVDRRGRGSARAVIGAGCVIERTADRRRRAARRAW